MVTNPAVPPNSSITLTKPMRLARIYRKRDRARLSLHANQLKRAVNKGLREVKKSRESIKPWMDPKGKSR